MQTLISFNVSSVRQSQSVANYCTEQNNAKRNQAKQFGPDRLVVFLDLFDLVTTFCHVRLDKFRLFFLHQFYLLHDFV